MNPWMRPVSVVETSGAVHCPICTHTVEARILTARKRSEVKAGQKCPRCGSSLDAAYVLSFERAA